MSRDVIIIEKAEFIRGTSKPYAITRNGKIVYWDNERWHEVNYLRKTIADTHFFI
jgi:hypothetical protein